MDERVWTGLDALALAADHWLLIAILAAVGLGMAGAVGKGLGIANLFRDDARLLTRRPGDSPLAILWASPAFWTHAGLALLTGLMTAAALDGSPICGAGCLWPKEPAGTAPALTWPILLPVGFGLLFLAASRRELRAPRVDGRRPPDAEIRIEVLRCAGGLLAGLVALAAVWAAAGRLAETVPIAPPLGVSAAFAWLSLIALAVLAVALGSRKVLPCLSLIGLLAAATLVIAVFERLEGGAGALAGLGLAALVVAANGRRFRLRIPGFPDALYDAAGETDPNAAGVLAKHPGAIDPVAALDAWAARERAEHGSERKPKLALLATSGGAYRASFWTALLLDHLLERGAAGPLAGLARSIRLVTGASGGMVAGAYFVAMRADGDDGPGVVARIEEDIEAFQRSAAAHRRRIAIPRDSLTPVAQRLVRGDLPRILLPGRPATDRGRALDAQWATLARSFAAVAPAEREGRAPSIVFSPMLVESGAPAFVTNLDLTELRRRSLGREDRETDINRESVELFDAFPQVWETLTMATVVRLNATFPYVSPAVSLPTIPTRRVVDAGYYDNYGVDLATAFLMTPAIRDWVLENCSGVAVLQARAFPTGDGETPKGRVARAFQWLSSPLEGVFRARASSQMFRNNQQLRRAKALYDEAKGEGFFESFAFEAAADASMSWYLPEDELRAMRALLPESARDPAPAGETVDKGREATAAKQENKLHAELARLAAFWGG